MKKNYDILSWERILLLFLVMFLPIPVLAQEINIRPKESGNSKIEKTENKEEIKKDNKAIDEKKQKNYYDYSFQSSLDFVLNNDISRNSNTPNTNQSFFKYSLPAYTSVSMQLNNFFEIFGGLELDFLNFKKPFFPTIGYKYFPDISNNIFYIENTYGFSINKSDITKSLPADNVSIPFYLGFGIINPIERSHVHTEVSFGYKSNLLFQKNTNIFSFGDFVIRYSMVIGIDKVEKKITKENDIKK